MIIRTDSSVPVIRYDSKSSNIRHQSCSFKCAETSCAVLFSFRLSFRRNLSTHTTVFCIKSTGFVDTLWSEWQYNSKAEQVALEVAVKIIFRPRNRELGIQTCSEVCYGWRMFPISVVYYCCVGCCSDPPTIFLFAANLLIDALVSNITCFFQKFSFGTCLCF